MLLTATGDELKVVVRDIALRQMGVIHGKAIIEKGLPFTGAHIEMHTQRFLRRVFHLRHIIR